MSVYRRFYGHRYPSLITTNVADRSPLLARQEAASALLRSLAEAEQELRFHLYAWVIMPDHVHLVIEVPDSLMSGTVLRFVKARFARRWNHRTGAGGSIWQTRFHERVLTSERALLAAVEYVHANPVAAGLVESAEDYVFSSARAWGERSQAELFACEAAAALLMELRARKCLGPAPA
jgi:REP element-mobilizing transposase RayT